MNTRVAKRDDIERMYSERGKIFVDHKISLSINLIDSNPQFVLDNGTEDLFNFTIRCDVSMENLGIRFLNVIEIQFKIRLLDLEIPMALMKTVSNTIAKGILTPPNQMIEQKMIFISTYRIPLAKPVANSHNSILRLRNPEVEIDEVTVKISNNKILIPEFHIISGN